MGQCQAAVAEAVEVFGRVDILFCCTSEGPSSSFLHLDLHGSRDTYGYLQLSSARSKSCRLRSKP
jgi:NAD(P)-dependent dehydrogenase (short-subunit alcohol dehydrogenase family)